MVRRTVLVALACALVLIPAPASALTMGQVTSICDQYQGVCSEHPYLQWYVGGALDLIAMLDEETDYLDNVYCEDPSTFFDVPVIIQYMLANQAGYADKNAMLLVIRYLVEKGGCQH